MTTPLLEATGLIRVYRERLSRGRRTSYALNGVSCSVSAGETLAVVGESGSGKSTLGRVLLGLEPPTGGTVRFEGHDLHALRGAEQRAVRRRMQVVFQDPWSSLNPRHAVGDAVGEGLVVHRLARGQALKDRVADLLRAVGLDASDAARFPHEFSGGQRQRIGLARALATEPAFLLCDEPVSALDVETQAQVLDLVATLQRDRQLGCLFISHDLAVVSRIAHRVAVMYGGRIVEDGPTAQVISRPTHPYTRALVAAVPRLLPVATPPTPLPGEPPPVTRRPEGCAFAPRCAHPGRDERCTRERPELRPLGPVRVACHHATENG